jgi:hypothetical protein
MNPLLNICAITMTKINPFEIQTENSCVLGAFAKLLLPSHVCLSVDPHGTILKMDAFW